MIVNYLLQLILFSITQLSLKSHVVLCLLVFWAISLSQAQTIRYVTTTGTNTDPTSATSWGSSTTSLQGAINSLSATGGEVWVAAGVYKPTITTNRNVSFSLRNKVTVYGGFPGSGNPGLTDRNPASFTTTLSGNLGYPDTADDNSYHVIANPSSLSLTSTAVLDGFVITGGNANGSDPNGAGMYNTAGSGSMCSPTIRYCTFMNNIAGYSGAGIMNLADGGVSSPIITNCSFSTNTAPFGSGGVHNGAENGGTCSPILTDCSFSDNDGRGVFNFASRTSGGIIKPVITDCSFDSNYGGMYNIYSNPQLINCRFTGNFSGARMGLGGGVYNDDDSNPVLVNCTFTGNVALNYGGGLYNASGAPVLINCVFDGNYAPFSGGGAIYHLGSSKMQLVNCTLVNNKSDSGGSGWGIYAEKSSPVQLTNCILWNNGGNKTFAGGTPPTVTYSVLEPSVYTYTYTDGGNNRVTSTSPFSSTANLSLSAGSPAINAGSNAAYTAVSGPATDLADNLRIQYGLIDLGAYESAFSHDLTPTLYARPSTANGAGAVTIVVDVEGINSVATHGLLTVKITKDPNLTLTLPASATVVNNRSVQNSSWQFSADDPDYYILTTQQSITAGDHLSFGLTGTLSPGSTSGVLAISTLVLSTDAQETKLTNNADADKVEYFQQ